MDHGKNNFLRRWLMLISLAVAICFPAAAQDQAVSESQLKAAFLYNFTKFVEWPAAAGEAATNPFTIGVLGDPAFGRQLNAAVHSETVKGRAITIRRLKKGDALRDCQIVFVSHAENENLEAVLNEISGQPVLVVTEADGAGGRGAMINLLVVQGSIKMEINLSEAKHAHLAISSYLLKLAKIVETEKTK